MNRILKLAALLLCLCVAVPAAYAQGICTLQTMTGSYAFYDKGSSLIVDPSQQPFPLHWAAAMAPFVAVGEVTFTPKGVGNGFYWISIGALSGGLNPIPVQVTITEMNPDCSGKYQYSITLPGISATIEERFVLFDNGREFRSVPTSIVNGVPTLAWTGTGRRISKSSKPVHTCGPQTSHGTYLLTAENIVTVDPTTAVADALFIRADIALTGDYTGTLYEKFGPLPPIELPASGKFTVSPDCSFSATLDVTIQGTPVSIPIRGVFFNEGKEYYGLAIDPGVPYSFAQGKRIGQ